MLKVLALNTGMILMPAVSIIFSASKITIIYDIMMKTEIMYFFLCYYYHLCLWRLLSLISWPYCMLGTKVNACGFLLSAPGI